MRQQTRFLMVLLAILALSTLSIPRAWAQSQTTTTETRSFEIVEVDGNKVVVKGENGARELTVPPDFTLTTADGRKVGVADLKPGMKGTATITTTTTSVPVQVTEVREAEVVSVSGNSVTVRTPNGFRMFGPGDLTKRNAKIYMHGQPVDFTQLRTGDKLTAVIVTEGPPAILTERQVKAQMTAAPEPKPEPQQTQPQPTPTPTPTPEPTPAPTPMPEEKPTKHMPHTASDGPLIGLIGGISLALAFALALRRRIARA
jgi:hypothetical protein